MNSLYQPERTTGGVTNAERAKSGGDALAYFARGQYHSELGEDIETALGDLMCDLMHFAASMGLIPAVAVYDAVRKGETHYVAEATEEPHEWGEEPPFATAPACDPAEWMKHYGS